MSEIRKHTCNVCGKRYDCPTTPRECRVPERYPCKECQCKATDKADASDPAALRTQLARQAEQIEGLERFGAKYKAAIADLRQVIDSHEAIINEQTLDLQSLRASADALAGACEGLLPPEDSTAADWWCPTCKQWLDGSHVTYQECCATCGTYLSDCRPYDKWRPLRKALANYRTQPGGPGERNSNG